MSSIPNADGHFMERALELAALSTRKALPNPSVGAVITCDGTIVAEGYHREFGGPHAEVHAIRSMRDVSMLSRATLYVTLEPCSHFGKTPPCVDLILSAGIPRIVVGCRDPFALVSGRGIQRLRDAGVEVIEGVLHDACVLQNKRFILAHRLRRPYIILKWARTQDGYIAPEDRSRLAISCAESVACVHHWRGQEMSIAVGSATVTSDDPLLTVRDLSRYSADELPVCNPVRVVIGDARRLPTNARVWNSDAATIVCTPHVAESNLPSHVEQIPLKTATPLESICDALYSRNILSILIEGGSQTLQRWIDAGLWDEARVFVSPDTLTQGVRAPHINSSPLHTLKSGIDTLHLYAHPEITARLNIERFTFDGL